MNLSTSANTFVIRVVGPVGAAALVEEPAPVDEVELAAAPEDDGARSFSLPRPVALLNAFTSGWTSRELPLTAAAEDELDAAALGLVPPATLLEEADADDAPCDGD